MNWFTPVKPTDWFRTVEVCPSLRKEGFVTAPAVLPPPTRTPAIFKADKRKSESIADWGQATRDILGSCFEASTAVLLRDLPIKDAQDLSGIVRASGIGLDMYDGVNRRSKVLGDEVYDATFSGNGSVFGFAHNEIFYRPGECNIIMFYCAKKAEVGGESVLVRNDEMTDLMGSDALDYIMSKGGIRNQYFSPSRDTQKAADKDSDLKFVQSWQKALRTEDKTEAEAYWSEKFECVEWDENDNLYMSNTLPGHITSPISGERLWYNGLTNGHQGSSFFCMTWGNGESLDQDLVQQAQTAMFKASVAFKLEPGDLLIMDNRQVAHGKLPHEGTQRKIWVLQSKDILS